MAYYVRKIARAKWNLKIIGSENVIQNYRADAIANDMRTTNDTLSFWRTDSLEPEDVNPIIVINSLLGDSITKIDLLCIPEEMISEFDLEQVDGNTILYSFKDRHYNVVELTVKKLEDFASDIVLTLLSMSEQNSEYIKRIKANDQLFLIDKYIASGQIKYEDLKERQKTDFKKYLEKTKR